MTADNPGDKETPRGDERSKPPQLSILHLMVWTAFSAIYLAVVRALTQGSGSTPENVESVRQTSSVINAIIVGALWTATIVMIRHGRPWCRHPGHWLVLISGLFNGLYVPLLLMMVLLSRFTIISQGWSLLLFGVMHLSLAVAYAMAAGHTERIRWRALFFFMALTAPIRSVAYWILPWSGNIGIIGLMVVGFADIIFPIWMVCLAIADLATRTRRDWLHWTGIATFLLAKAMTVVWTVMNWFTAY